MGFRAPPAQRSEALGMDSSAETDKEVEGESPEQERNSKPGLSPSHVRWGTKRWQGRLQAIASG